MNLPVQTLDLRLVGTNLQLADGSTAWALLGNVSLDNVEATRHFMTVSVHLAGKWFDLARYHDVDYARRDAQALAQFLRKDVSEVFPIAYDIAAVAKGPKEVLQGEVPALARVQLEQKDLIRLALRSQK